MNVEIFKKYFTKPFLSLKNYMKQNQNLQTFYEPFEN